MEDKVTMKFQLFIAIVLIALSSCSLIESTRKSLLEEDDPQPQKVVPKGQYDELMQKYEETNRSQNINNDTIKNNDAYGSIKNDNPPLEKIKMGAVANEDLVETVDVFSGTDENPNKVVVESPNSVKKKYVPQPNVIPVSGQTVDSDQARNEIVLFRKAMGFRAKNDNDNALRIFQTLENSPLAQIRVRAKYQIGEILFTQNEYDLAMQIYEEIIHHYAFSGVVIPALAKLVVCYEKLNIKDKKAKYQSILVDIFERT